MQNKSIIDKVVKVRDDSFTTKCDLCTIQGTDCVHMWIDKEKLKRKEQITTNMSKKETVIQYSKVLLALSIVIELAIIIYKL